MAESETSRKEPAARTSRRGGPAAGDSRAAGRRATRPPHFLYLTLNCSSGGSRPPSPQPRPAQSIRLPLKSTAARAPVSDSRFLEAEPAGVSRGLSILQLGIPKDPVRPLPSPLPRPGLTHEPATAPRRPRGPPLSRRSRSTESRCSGRRDAPRTGAAPEAQTQNTGPRQEAGCTDPSSPFSGLMHIHEQNNSGLQIMIHAGSTIPNVIIWERQTNF